METDALSNPRTVREAFFGRPVVHVWEQSPLWAKLLLAAGIVVSALLFCLIGTLIGVPGEPGFGGSLLQQPHSIVGVLVVIVSMSAVILAAAVIVSPLLPDAAVLCAACGVAALSLRGGTMQSVLFAASGRGVFLSLAAETALLFAGLVGAWFILQRVRGVSSNVLMPPADAGREEPERMDEKILALFAHASAMTAIMILLSRTDAKTQSLASVGVSSCLAAMAAYQVAHVRSSFWFWLSPLAVALFGYLYAALRAEGWETGVMHGAMAALARPLPLDYVSMGPAGAIVGCWLTGGGSAKEEDDAE